MFNERWSATLTYDYQRQTTLGAWDEDPTTTAPHGRSASVPSSSTSRPRRDFHVDGDVGIGDLVFASTYWSLPTRQWDEYSQYMENFDVLNGAPGSQEGFTCLNDPPTAARPFTGCNVAAAVLRIPHQSRALVG